jgi:hypothetical protein
MITAALIVVTNILVDILYSVIDPAHPGRVAEPAGLRVGEIP